MPMSNPMYHQAINLLVILPLSMVCVITISSIPGTLISVLQILGITILKASKKESQLILAGPFHQHITPTTK